MSESEVILHCPECASGKIVKTINSSEPDCYHCLDCKQELFESVEYSYITAFKKLQVENEGLKRKLDLAVEALEFYGDKNNWAAECFHCKEEDMEYLPNDNNSEDLWENVDVVSGKRARQALKEIGEER